MTDVRIKTCNMCGTVWLIDASLVNKTGTVCSDGLCRERCESMVRLMVEEAVRLSMDRATIIKQVKRSIDVASLVGPV